MDANVPDIQVLILPVLLQQSKGKWSEKANFLYTRIRRDKKISKDSETDLTAQSTSDIDSKDIEKLIPEIPGAISPFNLPSETGIIAILGTDYPYPHIRRTDSIFLLFLNKSSGNASLLSIPSDNHI